MFWSADKAFVVVNMQSSIEDENEEKRGKLHS